MLSFFSQTVSSIFGDTWQVLRYRGDQEKILKEFILGELLERAKQSAEGYAATHFGVKPFHYYPIVVILGDSKIAKNVIHGSDTDPEVRCVMAPLQRFLGLSTLINQSDQFEQKEERKVLMDALSRSESAVLNHLPVLRDLVGRTFEKEIDLFCMRVIAEAVLGIKEGIEHKHLDVLNEAESYLFGDKLSSPKFKALEVEMMQMSRELFKKNQEGIRGSYIEYPTDKGKKKLEDVNYIAALAAKGNVVRVLKGALLKLASSDEWQQALCEELQQKGETGTWQAIRALPFLDRIYQEALLCFPPKQPIVRYISKEMTVETNQGGTQVTFPKGTVFFIPMEPKKEFTPTPTQTKKGTPVFSVGSRACPAANGFVEKIFKYFLVELFGVCDCRIKLTEAGAIEAYPYQRERAPVVYAFNPQGKPADKRMAENENSMTENNSACVGNRVRCLT